MYSTELNPFTLVEESGLFYVVVHLFDWNHFGCEDYHMEMGIDLDSSIDDVECVFVEPHTAIYARFPDVSGPKFLEVCDELQSE